MANVPLTPNYEHTLTFASREAQSQYFSSKVVQSAQFTNISYQRHNSGTIRLSMGMDKLDTVNYLRFENPNSVISGGSHEAKVFYAFITEMNYISDAVTEITYSIDVIQTWFFDFSVNPCFIEREHTNDDKLGANLVDEGIDTGDLICQDMEVLDRWLSSRINSLGEIELTGYYLLIATQSPSGSQGWHVVGGVPNALYFYVAGDVNELGQQLNAFINGATQNLDPIIAIYMMPDGWYVSQSQQIFESQMGTFVTKRCTLTKDFSVGVGPFVCYDSELGTNKTYYYKNKKLLTSPYNYMILESPDGKTVKLKYENFKNIGNHQQFDLAMSIFPYVETLATPVDYECQSSIMSSNGQVTIYVNPEYAVSCKQYPTLGVASDAFMAWWAQNKYSMPMALAGQEAASAVAQKQYNTPDEARSMNAWDRNIETIKNLLGISGSGGGSTQLKVAAAALKFGTSLAQRNFGTLGTIGSTMETVGAELAAYKGHQALPATIACKAENGGVFHAINDDCYKIYYMRVKPEYAEIIDNYFSCFGYKTHIVKTPNIFGRSNWNYVKTVGCTISGNIPAEADDKIRQIFDRGLTFWHNPSTMYDYSQNNSIVT